MILKSLFLKRFWRKMSTEKAVVTTVFLLDITGVDSIYQPLDRFVA